MSQETPGSTGPIEPRPQTPTGYGAAAGYGITPAAPVVTGPTDPAAPVEVEVEVDRLPDTGPSLLARMGAEAFGTFVLVLAGLGTGVYASYTGAGALGVALAFGLGAAVAYLVVGRVSGGQFNPAITLGAVLAGRTRLAHLVPYWLAQLVGGALASTVLYTALATFPALAGSERSFFSSGAAGFNEHSPLAVSARTDAGFTVVAALLVETVLVAVLTGVYLAVTERRFDRGHAAAGIGGSLALAVLVAGPVTNAGLNPARATAAAIFSESWAWGQLWVFWVAPLFGALLAGLVYRGFVSPEPAGALDDDLLDDEDEGADETLGEWPADGPASGSAAVPADPADPVDPAGPAGPKTIDGERSTEQPGDPATGKG